MLGSNRWILSPPTPRRCSRSHGSWPAVSLFALVLVALLPGPTSAADPFYERLLEKGKRGLASDVEEAEEDLRLACFGLLEEPDVLADCLVHLAVAQTLRRDDAAFRETSTRILELESRFEVYGGLGLSSSVREIFESQLETSISYESLADLEAFHGVAERVLEAELAELSGADRRRRLEELRQREPDALRWLIMMSEVELEDGNYNAALEMAILALRRDTELLRAICVKGRAQAALGNCAEALDDLISCDDDSPERNGEITMARLRCRVSLGDWDEAEALLEQLGREGLSNAESRDLARRVRRGRRQAPPPAEQPPAEPGAEPVIE